MRRKKAHFLHWRSRVLALSPTRGVGASGRKAKNVSARARGSGGGGAKINLLRLFPPSARFDFRTGYVCAYNLLQFCGHSWVLANMVTRILRFGRGYNPPPELPAFAPLLFISSFLVRASATADALADTFYSVGFAASMCQLLSILELYHIADGIEDARLLPRFIQVTRHARHLRACAVPSRRSF